MKQPQQGTDRCLQNHSLINDHMATKDILQLKCSRATTGQGFEPAQIIYVCVCSTKSDLSEFDRVDARGAFG